ncbi:MAG TPA: cellulase family glycosylhydrolase, partial [Chloroflexota bacterium]|nr:cellulase family glycosylhydrolase [Chloroflexota bacterium]
IWLILVLIAASITAASPHAAEAPSDWSKAGLAAISDASPAHRPLLGVNLHPLQNIYSIYQPDQLLDRATETGATVVRIDVHWDWFEWTEPGVAGWDSDQAQRLAAFLESAQRHNLPVLAVVMDAPCWASSDPRKVCGLTEQRYNWREPPANPDDFAAFLSRLVTRYGRQIRYWEIWNEPNLPQFWTRPDPVAYVRLLRAAYPAIKSSDPTATVLAGALAPIEPDQFGIPTFDYVEAMYSAGAKGFFDALSFHPYTDGQSPVVDRPRWPAHSFGQSVPVLHAAMLRAGDASPIWLTESGWPTTPSCPSCGWQPTFTSEADQARYLAQEIGLVRNWTYVDALVWYELFDRGASQSTSAEDHFGLFHHDLSPKPIVGVLNSLSSAN